MLYQGFDIFVITSWESLKNQLVINEHKSENDNQYIHEITLYMKLYHNHYWKNTFIKKIDKNIQKNETSNKNKKLKNQDKTKEKSEKDKTIKTTKN